MKNKLPIAVLSLVILFLFLAPMFQKEPSKTALAEEFLLKLYTSDVQRYEDYMRTPEDFSIYKDLYKEMLTENMLDAQEQQ